MRNSKPEFEDLKVVSCEVVALESTIAVTAPAITMAAHEYRLCVTPSVGHAF
jgi:hypothetical protein